jgi:predicted ATP-grasp superfamily ATP-dependent carboligase
MQYKTELLLDYESRVLGSFAYAKIRYYPPSGGSSTLNKSLYYPEMVDHAVRLARSIGWYGMCDFDFIYDVRDRQIKLMEINPRWTDTIRIASLGGVDFPKMVYQVVSGQPVDPVTTYRAGLYMRFLPGEVLWFLAARDKRFRTQPSWFRFFAPDTKYLISMLDDPGPLMGYVLECIAALLSPEMRAYRLRTKRKSDPESDPS